MSAIQFALESGYTRLSLSFSIPHLDNSWTQPHRIGHIWLLSPSSSEDNSHLPPLLLIGDDGLTSIPYTIHPGDLMSLIDSEFMQSISTVGPPLAPPPQIQERHQMTLTFPTQAEQVLSAFNHSPKTISLATLARKHGAHITKTYEGLTTYTFDDDTSLSVTGRGISHRVTTHLP